VTYSPLTNRQQTFKFDWAYYALIATKMDIKNKVGNRIKELRLSKKLSQEALANIAEVDRTYMTSVENGRRNISVAILEKIIKALDTSYSVFFNSKEFEE
jgi:DNA-binding XRE family transcriptional regulator